MALPNEMPRNAFSTLLNLLSKDKPTKELIALATYELVGYGLYCWLGDVKYPMQLDFAKIFQIMNSPEFASAKAAVVDFQADVLAGTSRWRALIKVLVKHGPEALKLVLLVISMVE